VWWHSLIDVPIKWTIAACDRIDCPLNWLLPFYLWMTSCGQLSRLLCVNETSCPLTPTPVVIICLFCLWWIISVLAPALQALSNPYCQSVCLFVSSFDAKYLGNYCDLGGRVQYVAYRNVSVARRSVKSSMTSRDCDVMIVTSQSSKSSRSDTRTRINYPCIGPLCTHCGRTLWYKSA